MARPPSSFTGLFIVKGRRGRQERAIAWLLTWGETAINILYLLQLVVWKKAVMSLETLFYSKYPVKSSLIFFYKIVKLVFSTVTLQVIHLSHRNISYLYTKPRGCVIELHCGRSLIIHTALKKSMPLINGVEKINQFNIRTEWAQLNIIWQLT